MKVYTWFLLSGIFASTNSILRIRPKGDHRGVNLPQKTVQDNNLYNIHNFQTTGTTLTDQNKNMKLVFRAPILETLTDFIQEAIRILNTYENFAFEDFFHILGNEIRKYHYRGCKFSELTQNSYFRSLLVGLLKSIRWKPVYLMKANINEVADMIRNERYDKNVKELLDYINSLYRNTKPIFHNVLKELKYYKKMRSIKTHNDLVQIIRGGLRAILFDHYTELKTSTRRKLKERIEIFWKLLKNNSRSSTEMNDIPYTDSVIKSVVNSIKVLQNPELYSKNDPQIKLKNKTERIVSLEAHNENFQNDEPEMNKNSNEFWKPATDYVIDEISSGQSLDSSSNSIQNSLERHKQYNTQRYLTLYTEEISYKAKTTKKTENIPLSVNVITRRLKVKKRPAITSTPRERHVWLDRTEKLIRADTDDTKLDSSHNTESSLTLESKHEPRAKQNYDKPQKHGKADESRSKRKHRNARIISQYDAVIDVQLANTKLSKSLGMFEPVGMDTNSRSRYDTTLYLKSDIQTKPVPSKPTTQPQAMRAQAVIKPQTPTAPTKPSRYSKRKESLYRKRFNESKRSIVPNESQSVTRIQYKRINYQRQKFIARRSNNDTIGVKDFNTYVIKRIDTLESELKELRQMNNFKIQRKDMKGNIIERLLNENHDLNNEGNSKENCDEHTTRSNTMNIKSSTNNTPSSKPNVIKKDSVNATVIDNKNTSQVTNNNVNVTNNTKELNKVIITKNVTFTVTSVTNTMKLESVVTTPTVGVTRRTMAYSEPSYYDYPVPPNGKSRSQLDPFGHISDGFYFNM